MASKNEKKDVRTDNGLLGKDQAEFDFGVYVIRNPDHTFVMNIVPGKKEDVRLSDVMHLLEDAKLELIFRSMAEAMMPGRLGGDDSTVN